VTTPDTSDSLSEANAPASAIVIPFPVRSKPLASRRRLSRHTAADGGDGLTTEHEQKLLRDRDSPVVANCWVAPPGPTPEQRLTRALASLNTALADQRVAVAAWRDGLLRLKTTTAGLTDSLHRYRVTLDRLNNSVSALRDKADSLEKWADGVTATAD